MDFEDHLTKLQRLCGHALHESAFAKARYLDLAGNLAATPVALANALLRWKQSEARKTRIIEQMVALEELECDVTA
jgi:hypothetical protein